MKPFISLCMIVKNEEKVIERCLSSVAHLVDEVVIVDTGSIDNTKEIITRYTSNIYDFEWINDFSAARNFAASKATGEWILVLDADEYIDEENFKIFSEELREGDSQTLDAYTAKILNFTGNFAEGLVQNYHDRIYKNNGEISYYRSIHEQFKKNDDTLLKVGNSSLLIFHSGYLNHTVSEKDKNDRNKKLLDKEFIKGNNRAFDHFNLGNEYCSKGDYEKALNSYLEAYKHKSDFRLSWVSVTLVQIIICLINLKRYNDALKVIDDAEKLYSSSPEFPFLKGEIMFVRGQLDDAKYYFQELINNEENYSHTLIRPDLKDQLPHRRLGELFLHEKDYQNAIYHFVSVLNINKYCDLSIKRVMHILNKFHTVEEISEFLISNDLIEDKNLKIYVYSCFDIGNPDLAFAILDGYQKNDEPFNSIVKIKKISIDNDMNIEDIIEIVEPKVLAELFTTGWVNIVDLFLIRSKLRNSSESSILNFLENDKYLNNLETFLEKGTAQNNVIEDSLYITALKYFLDYKQLVYCDLLLKNTNHLNTDTLIKIANILNDAEFKAEALHFYNKVDWNLLNAQDFINIISCLLETKDIENALQISDYALQKFPDDFRFYKYIFENTIDENIFTTILAKSKNQFKGSIYLERFFI